MNWRTILDFADRKLLFKEIKKEVQLIRSHLLVKLELIGRWRDKDAVFLVKKEDDVKTQKLIERVTEECGVCKKSSGLRILRCNVQLLRKKDNIKEEQPPNRAYDLFKNI